MNEKKDLQVLVLVLNYYEKLNELLSELNDAGIKGATVINSTGMAQELSKETDVLFGSLKSVLTPERENNRTVFMVLDEKGVKKARSVINRVLGPIESSGAGILFSVPVLFIDGQRY